MKYKHLVGTKARQTELMRMAGELCSEILDAMGTVWTLGRQS